MQNPINVMVDGLPGNMATKVAEYILGDERFKLITLSLTGPEINLSKFTVGQQTIVLIHPHEREHGIEVIREAEGEFISVDFTHPTAANANAEFYCAHGLPFVMGTTGGDRQRLNEVVAASHVSAVIALNMAKQVVGLQAMMEYAADTFPGLFSGYSLEIKESHQAGKADTSGTAKAMVEQPDGSPGIFNKLGVPFTADQIIKIRNPLEQINLGVPEAFLGGHGWHTYTLVSPNKKVKVAFVHNVNGRDIYAEGALDAIAFLDKKVKEGVKGRVFTMIDVLKG